MQVLGPMDLQGGAMKPNLGTRSYTFKELMNRIDMDYWYVVESKEEPDQHFTFVPVQYRGK